MTEALEQDASDSSAASGPLPQVEIAFIGLVLLICFFVPRFAGPLQRDHLFSLLPSLIMLAATFAWTFSFKRCSTFHGTNSRLCLALGVGAIAVSFVVSLVLQGDAELESKLRRYGFILFALPNLVLLVPFAEEYFFRGLVLDHLSRNTGPKTGLFLTSILFAFMHWPQGIFVQMFLLSLLLCFVTMRTENVLPSTLIHFIWNAAVVVFR